MPFLWHCSTNGKLRILVKAQPCTPSTWPLSPTRLGIRPWDLGLSNEYTLGHYGLSAAFRHKLASTSSHHALLTATDTTALYWTPSCVFFCVFFFLSRSKLIFKVPTTTWGVPPGHILTNLIINWLLDGNANRKWGKSPSIRTVNDWWLPKLAICYQIKKTKTLSAWISRFVNLKKPGYCATLRPQ